MLTNNFYNAFLGGAFGKTCKVTLYSGSSYTVTQKASAYTGACIGLFAGPMSKVVYDASDGQGILLGVGEGEASADDYTLNGGYASSSSRIATTTAYSATEDETGVTHTAVITVTNNYDFDYTITELGLMNYCMCSASSSSGKPVLIDHTFLESPLTIPAGGVGQITYTIRVDFPVLPTA